RRTLCGALHGDGCGATARCRREDLDRGRGHQAVLFRNGRAGGRPGAADPRRGRLHQGICHRALLSRRAPVPHLRGHQPDPAAGHRAQHDQGWAAGAVSVRGAIPPRGDNMSESNSLYQGCTMGDLVVRAIQRGGDKVAFVLDEEQLSYREFGAQLSRFIQALKARGLRHGDAVAAITSNRPEGFLVTAAAYLMGLRITWMHPMASEDDHAYLVEDSGVGTLDRKSV